MSVITVQLCELIIPLIVLQTYGALSVQLVTQPSLYLIKCLSAQGAKCIQIRNAPSMPHMQGPNKYHQSCTTEEQVHRENEVSIY